MKRPYVQHRGVSLHSMSSAQRSSLPGGPEARLGVGGTHAVEEVEISFGVDSPWMESPGCATAAILLPPAL